jgi:hypothetical protein
VIDGEPAKLGKEAIIGFKPCAFRALTPRVIRTEHQPSAANGETAA